MRLANLMPQFFQDEPLPAHSILVGWPALVANLRVRALVRAPAIISGKPVRERRRSEGPWTVYDKRYLPEGTLEGHLNFALQYEPIDFLILKRVFGVVPQKEIESIIRATPLSAFSRRLWFFYEMLTGRRLDLDDAPAVTTVPALDPKLYFTGRGRVSLRHRVLDNLLGTGALCPVIRRTAKLETLIALNLAGKAQETIDKAGSALAARAASALLLADCRASFETEGPTGSRLARWRRAVAKAGKRPLDQAEIYRLQRILISDDRLTPIGYRQTDAFLGWRDSNNEAIPDFIGARHQDVSELMSALIECNQELHTGDIMDLHPVLQATILAFGFVYIHPLADANGRLHRCLIHHVLAKRNFTPPGMVFPISSVMRDRIDDYRTVLQEHFVPLMDFIDWSARPGGGVEVSDDTADLYRYFDCTREAEFLYNCVQRAVEEDLPREIEHLKRQEVAKRGIMDAVEMSGDMAQRIIFYVRQNNGRLGRRRYRMPFSALKDDEIATLERIVTDAFPEGWATSG